MTQEMIHLHGIATHFEAMGAWASAEWVRGMIQDLIKEQNLDQ
jgi:hypothetical protein